ncbi:MAG: hypothetical protein AB7O59_13835 [Pirellulales bacterium]
MSSGQRVVLLSACALLACGLIAATAQAADPRAQLTRLFQFGLKNTPPAVAGANHQQQLLGRELGDDVRVDYAYGVVLAQQRRYDDALAYLSKYLTARPADLAAWRVRIWAEMQDQRYEAVLGSAATMGKLLAAAQPPQVSPEQLAAATFLGATFTYLERVRTGAIDAERLTANKNALLAQLGNRYRAAWDEGRTAVVSQFDQMNADREARLRGEQLASADKIKRTEAELADKVKEARGEREVTQASTEQLQSASRELSIIALHLNSLAQDRARLSAQIVVLQAQMAEVQQPTTTQLPAATTNRPSDTTPRPGDVFQRNATSTRTGVSLDRYAQAQTIAFALAAVNKQAFEIDREILALRTRAAELGDKGAQEAVRLAKSQQTAAKAAKKAGQLEKQLQRSESERQVRSKSAALTSRMTQFSTYVPLPYEQEAKRVLSWFAK